MRELPKSVLDRLKASTALPEHPDADVLTAFAERALPASERAVVLEHLARCGGCRDIVTLALPPQEIAEPAAASVGLRSRWQWPVLRGAAVAAGVIAVAVVGIYQYQHRTPANVMVAKSVEHEAVPASPASNKTETAAPQPQAVTPSAEARPEVVHSRSALVAGKLPSSTAGSLGWRAKPPGEAAGSGGGTGSGAGAGLAPGTKMAMAEAPSGLAFAPSTLPPSAQTAKQIPAASQVIEVQAQNEVVTVEAQTPTLNTQTAQLQAPGESTDDVRRAKSPATASGATAVANAPILLRNYTEPQQVQQASMMYWTITNSGGLQRSSDGGKTWQDVNVNAKPGLYGGSQGAIVSRNQATRTAAKDAAQDEKKSAKLNAAPTPVFRAVAAIGNEVWAGASGGLLYHSADAGTFWSSIIPSAQGVTLSGDITRIEFSDPLHGKITTSTSETWTTADGGQSWQKQ